MTKMLLAIFACLSLATTAFAKGGDVARKDALTIKELGGQFRGWPPVGSRRLNGQPKSVTGAKPLLKAGQKALYRGGSNIYVRSGGAWFHWGRVSFPKETSSH